MESFSAIWTDGMDDPKYLQQVRTIVTDVSALEQHLRTLEDWQGFLG